MIKKKKKKKTNRTNGSNTTKSTSGKRRMISLELVNLQMVALLVILFLIGKINTTFYPLKKRPVWGGVGTNSKDVRSYLGLAVRWAS